MVQGGNWSVEKGSRTINPRGRLDCASFFLLLCGRRRELQQWLVIRGEVTKWWRACGREGRGCGHTATDNAQLGGVLCAAEEN